MDKKELTVEKLVDKYGKDLELEFITGHGGGANAIRSAEITRPGLAFAGFLDVFSHDRIQIVGNTEMSYIRSLDADERARRFERILAFQIPCIIVTNANPIPEDIIALAGKHNVPLLRTPLMTTRVVSLLNSLLERFFAPEMQVHGELVDVFGMGTLIVGESGVGKSECALELVERGHRLVADDVVVLRRLSKYEIVGRSKDLAKYHMEIRGIGILNVEMLFGVSAICEEKRIDLVVQLEQWNEEREYERLGLEDHFRRFFDDVDVPEYIIPVMPGRNISIIVEMAALTQRLKNAGVNPAALLDKRIQMLAMNNDME